MHGWPMSSPSTHTLICWFSPQVNLLWPEQFISPPAISRFLCASLGILPLRNVVDLAQPFLTTPPSPSKCPSLPAPDSTPQRSSPRAGRRVPFLQTEAGGDLPPKSWAPLYMSISVQWATSAVPRSPVRVSGQILKPYVVALQINGNDPLWRLFGK